MDRKDKKNNQQVFHNALKTGFIGGLFWGALAVLLHYFNFTELNPKHFMLTSWLRVGWAEKWQGDLLSLLLFGLLSMLIGAIYYIIFKKIYSMWAGVIYGVILASFFLFVIYPQYSQITPLADLKFATYVTTICLYILYGLFVGFTISYDYYDIKVLGNQGLTDRP